jgi:hypothetical protein
MNAKKLVVAVLAAGLLGVVYVSSAAATPPSTDPPEASDLVSGPLDGSTGRHPLRVEQDGVELKVKQPTTVATFDLTYEPLEFSGWHSHPGIVVVVVKSGTVERTTPGKHGHCTTQTFTAGTSFTEVGTHDVANPSATDAAVLSITRIYPSDATVSRIDQPAPDCG